MPAEALFQVSVEVAELADVGGGDGPAVAQGRLAGADVAVKVGRPITDRSDSVSRALKRLSPLCDP